MPADYINVAGFDLLVTAGARAPDAVRGEAVRAFDNTLLNGTDGGKGTWRFTVYPKTLEDAAAFRAAVGAGNVECWGRRLLVAEGAPIMCHVVIEGETDGPDVQGRTDDWSDANVTLSITVEEK